MEKLDDICQLNLDEKISCVGSLIIELEHLESKLNHQLELVIEKISNDIPKVARHLSNQNDELNLFNSVISQAQSSINTKASKTVDSLLLLDKIVDRIIATQSCIKDADNWNSVSGEMEALYIAKDYEKACARLEEAERSLTLLSTNGFDKNTEERRQLLDNLKSRFKSMLIEEFGTSIIQGDHSRSRQLIDFLVLFGSHSDIHLQYYNIRRPELIKRWNISLNENLETLVIQIRDFLHAVLSFWRQEILTFTDNPAVFMFEGLSRFFNEITPTFPQILHHLEESRPNETIIFVTDIYALLVEFGNQVESLYQNQGDKRDVFIDWGKVVFQSFATYQKKYEYYENAYLKSVSAKIDLTLEEALEVTRKCLKRYLIFTQGLLKMDFQSMLDRFLSERIEVIKKKASETDTIEAALNFLELAISFHENLQKNWDFISINLKKGESDMVVCQSSAIPFKSLRREYQILETSCSYSSLQLARDLIVENQKRLVQTVLMPLESSFLTIKSLSFPSSLANNAPQFSISPSSASTFIGEYILTLPQIFDPYSQDRALSYSLHTLPGFDKREEENEDETESSYDVTQAWTIACARMIESHIVDSILSIKSLNQTCTNQIVADIKYLQNIMAAIDMEPQSRFVDLGYALQSDPQTLKDELQGETIRDQDLLRKIYGARSSFN